MCNRQLIEGYLATTTRLDSEAKLDSWHCRDLDKISTVARSNAGVTITFQNVQCIATEHTGRLPVANERADVTTFIICAHRTSAKVGRVWLQSRNCVANTVV